jgi:KDO2-lipid IV(A) lauroyltransferase
MKKEILRSLLCIFEKLPISVLMHTFEWLANVCWMLDAKHRKIAKINLDIAFPEMERGKKSRIIRRTYKNMARTVAEIIKIGNLDDKYLRGHVRFEGLDNILDPHEKGTGVFAVTAHYGNWELMASTFGKYFADIDVIVRPQRESFVNTYLNEKWKLFGNNVIIKFDSAREIMKRIGGGRIIGVLMDQDTHLNRGKFVDFFGLPACTLDAIPRIAYATGAKMVPVFPMRDPANKYRHTVRFLPALNPDVEDRDEFVRLSLERINRTFEEVIGNDPEHWLWFHRRWRTRPVGYEAIYDI